MTNKDEKILFGTIVAGAIIVLAFILIKSNAGGWEKPEDIIEQEEDFEMPEIEYVTITQNTHDCKTLANKFLTNMYSYDVFMRYITEDQAEEFGNAVWMENEEKQNKFKYAMDYAYLRRIDGDIQKDNNSGSIRFYYFGPDIKKLVEDIQYNDGKGDIEDIEKEIVLDFVLEGFQWKIRNPMALVE